MVILDEFNNRTLTSLLLLLTPDEARELVDKLQAINPAHGDHIHVNDRDFAKEITVAVYTPKNLHFFSEHIKKLAEVEG